MSEEFDCDDFDPIEREDECDYYNPESDDLIVEANYEGEFEGLSDDLKILVQEHGGSVISAKKSLMQEYVWTLNNAIKNGARYGDGIIEEIKAEYQPLFEELEPFIEEEKKINAINNMIDKKNDDYIDYSSGFSLEEIYNDIKGKCC